MRAVIPDADVDRVRSAVCGCRQAVDELTAALDGEPSPRAARRALRDLTERQSELIRALIELLKTCTRELDEEQGEGERGPAAG